MVFYPSDLVEKIRKDRLNGLSLRLLEKKFQVPNTTISIWVRDIKTKNPVAIRNKLKRQTFIDEYKNISNFQLNSSNTKLLVALLYWCEGGKYPSSNALTFANSDLELLRKAFKLEKSKLRCHLQVHSSHDYPKVLSYWSDLLNIPETQFLKPTVTQAKNKMKRRNYQGTCTVKYYDLRVLLNVMGVYENFAKL